MAASTLVSCNDDTLEEMQAAPQAHEEEVDDFTPEMARQIIEFRYDNMGTTSPSQFVGDINYGPATSQGTRGGIIKAAGNLIMDSVLEALKSEPASYAVSAVLDMIFADNDGTMEQLNDLDSKLDDISEMITELKSQTLDAELSSLYNQRLEEFNSLDFNACTLFTTYYEAVKKGDKQAIDKVLDDWFRLPVNKTNAPTATYNYLLATTMKNNSQQFSITDIYDYWVYQTTPWEHMGYQKRDQLRLNDICVSTSCYLLTRAYYENLAAGSGSCNKAIEKLDKAYEAFTSFYKDNATVERHDDKLICQIKGAHIVFDKELVERDMKNHPWCPDDTRFTGNLDILMYTEEGVKSKTVLEHSLTKKEAETIFNYYKQLDSNITFDGIMEQAGFDTSILKEGKTHVMTLQAGCHKEGESIINRNYFMYFDEVLVGNGSKPFFNNWKVGCMWIDKTGIKKSYEHYRHWDHYCSEDSQYFRVNITDRYNGMYPMDNANK